jgi:hypothetical protein
MCANVAKDEIKDLVYETAVNQPLNPTTDLPTAYTTLFNWTTLGTLQTPIDDVFGWEPQYRPVFYKYPIAFNTVSNSILISCGTYADVRLDSFLTVLGPGEVILFTSSALVVH